MKIDEQELRRLVKIAELQRTRFVATPIETREMVETLDPRLEEYQDRRKDARNAYARATVELLEYLLNVLDMETEVNT